MRLCSWSHTVMQLRFWQHGCFLWTGSWGINRKFIYQMSTPTPKTIQQICDEDTGDSSLITNLVRRGKDLERELSDMQARAEAAEALNADARKLLQDVMRSSGIYDTAVACSGKVFADVYMKTGDEIRSLLASSPAETRSVIAGLREAGSNLRNELKLYFDSDLTGGDMNDGAAIAAWDAVSGAHAGAKGKL